MGFAANLDGKTALVTGASSGLGMRFAKVLAKEGARVVLAARRVDRLQELGAAIREDGGSAHVVPLDVTNIDSIRAAIARAETEAGPIDVLVNNSGVASTKRLVDVQPEDYDFVFNTNARGAFFVAQEVAKRMIQRASTDPDRQARIINIASVGGLRPLARIGIYCVSKAALIHMTRSMALEWGRFGINVNAICPGYIRTELNDAYFNTEAGQKLIQLLPRRRVGDPSDLDGVVLLLACAESRFMNGSIVCVDDGESVA